MSETRQTFLTSSWPFFAHRSFVQNVILGAGTLWLIAGHLADDDDE